jgi:hypothetical protein
MLLQAAQAANWVICIASAAAAAAAASAMQGHEYQSACCPCDYSRTQKPQPLQL